jgi:hypothetical protein
MFSIKAFEKALKKTFKQLKKDQAEALSIEIAANFTAGMNAGEKNKSFIPLASAEQEDDELTDDQKEEIALLVALYLGYISKFNDEAENQILGNVKTMIQEGKSEANIKKYTDDVFEGRENIVIDNTGQERKEIYVDKNLKLSEVVKTVIKPYYASVLTYASALGSNAAHASYEAGKKAYNIEQGNNQWVFVGPADEIARPWHVALLGSVYEYGSKQSAYAERCLAEPHCRHRAQVYYGDERDKSANYWRKLKEDAGLQWDDHKKQWALRGNVKTPNAPTKEVKEKQPNKEPPKEVKRNPDEVKKVVKDHEKEIKDNKVEHGAVFSTNGDIILKKVGAADHITWTREEREVMQGTILTHNHPNNAGFSPEDIKFACGNGLKEIRAVGSTRSYSIHFADGREFTQEDWVKLQPAWERNYQMGVAKERMRYKNNPDPDKKWNADEATTHVANFAWSRTVKKVDGLVYKVEVVK